MASRKKRGKTAKPRKTPTYMIPQNELRNVQKIRVYGLALSVMVLIWIVIKPVPYFIIFPIAFIIPIVSIVLLYRYHEIFAQTRSNSDRIPTEWYPLLLPIAGLVIRLSINYDLTSQRVPLTVAGILSITAAIFLIYQLKNLDLKPWEIAITAIGILPVFLAYFWSALIFTNCYLDTSDPQVFPAKVLFKRIEEGDSSDAFYVDIDAGGPSEPPLQVDVSEDFFDEVGQGDEVTVILKEGTLRFPWYTIKY